VTSEAGHFKSSGLRDMSDAGQQSGTDAVKTGAGATCRGGKGEDGYSGRRPTQDT